MNKDGYWYPPDTPVAAYFVLQKVAEILGYSDVRTYLEASKSRLAIRRRIKKAIRTALNKEEGE